MTKESLQNFRYTLLHLRQENLWFRCKFKIFKQNTMQSSDKTWWIWTTWRTHEENSKKRLQSMFCCKSQKQPSRDVVRKRYSENMQQIYRRTPMLKCISIKLQNTFSQENLWSGASEILIVEDKKLGIYTSFGSSLNFWKRPGGKITSSHWTWVIVFYKWLYAKYVEKSKRCPDISIEDQLKKYLVLAIIL